MKAFSYIFKLTLGTDLEGGGGEKEKEIVTLWQNQLSGFPVCFRARQAGKSSGWKTIQQAQRSLRPRQSIAPS